MTINHSVKNPASKKLNVQNKIILLETATHIVSLSKKYDVKLVHYIFYYIEIIRKTIQLHIFYNIH